MTERLAEVLADLWKFDAPESRSAWILKPTKQEMDTLATLARTGHNLTWKNVGSGKAVIILREE